MKPLFEGAKRLLIRNLTVKNDSTPKLKGPIYATKKKTNNTFSMLSNNNVHLCPEMWKVNSCFIISESHPDGTLYTLWFHRSYSPTLFSTPSNQGSIKHVCRSTENRGLNTIFFQRSVLFCFLFVLFFCRGFKKKKKSWNWLFKVQFCFSYFSPVFFHPQPRCFIPN